MQLGDLTLLNRVVMTTVKLGYSNNKGEVNNRHIGFYKRRAEGGVGLMTSEPMYVQLNGCEHPTQLGIYAEELVQGLQLLTDAVEPCKALEAIWEGFGIRNKVLECHLSISVP
jgi:2,4-dienoyl-CoA reductase-like NADH-dependent reductase (Old Yellow Enzyme family)